MNSSSQVFTVGLDSSRHITLRAPDMGLDFTSSSAIALSTWQSIGVRFSATNIALIIDNAIETATFTSRTVLTATECRVGGFNGQIDEFCFRDSHSESLPAEPVQAKININDLGGFGSGNLGDVTLSGYIANLVTRAEFTPVSSSSSFCTGTINPEYMITGSLGAFAAGQEVMLHNYKGDFCFRYIVDVSGSTIKIDSAPSFSGVCSMVQVPNYKSLTIPAGCTLNVPQYYAPTHESGGILAMRIKGDCTVNGKIIGDNCGRVRDDSLQLMHGNIIDKFIINQSGGIFITCGGTFTATSNARIGIESMSGSSKGGTPRVGASGLGGGAGYGGAGGDAQSYNNGGYSGGYGGVGGGGGGVMCFSTYVARGTGFDAGYNGHTGGSFAGDSPKYQAAKAGGTQGVTTGGNALPGGGGGAGGNGKAPDGSIVSAGCNVIILANTINVDMDAISTGGRGGWYGDGGYTDSNGISGSFGGGGTGFCYIACQRMVDNN